MSAMESNILKHAGYTGSVEVSVADGCLHGRIQHIHDVITYEGETVEELRREFVSAVDGYLSHCQEIGKSPDRPCSGTFNVRIGPERHRLLLDRSLAARKSLNEVVCAAIDQHLDAATTSALAAILPDVLQLISTRQVVVTSTTSRPSFTGSTTQSSYGRQSKLAS